MINYEHIHYVISKKKYEKDIVLHHDVYGK